MSVNASPPPLPPPPVHVFCLRIYNVCVLLLFLEEEKAGGLVLCIVMPQLTVPVLTAILFATDDHFRF